MASPQIEKGYTMIANELLEALMRYKFPPKASLPQKICFFVIRKTYGYHKKMDKISLSQFQGGTGEKNRTNLCYWLKFLVQAKILFKEELPNKEVSYGLNKNYDEWLPLVQARALVQARIYGSTSYDTKGSTSYDTHKRKERNITKEMLSNESGNLIPEVIKLFESVNPACKRYYGNVTQRKACQDLLDTYGFDELSKVIAFLPKNNSTPFMPKANTPLQLWDKFQSIKDSWVQQKNKQLSKFKGIA